MTASVRIDLDRRTVLAVPARAIRQEGGRSVVRVVVDGGGSEARPVRMGWRDGPWVEITDGLVEGDRILLDAPATSVEEQR
jgi:multidrug efflux pump subunit AcrA (membrane-fusion protein)